MSSTDPIPPRSARRAEGSGAEDADPRRHLPAIARRSMAHHLEHGSTPPLDDLLPPDAPLPGPLTAEGAAFVTLYRETRLRGCMGTLQPQAPLAGVVARCAVDAAFRDPRFPPLAWDELEWLAVTVSVLDPPEPLAVSGEDELIQQLRPGRDGLILAEGRQRATFLPAVWEQLPDPRAFVRHLKRKAGLPEDHWSPHMRVERYGSTTYRDRTWRTPPGSDKLPAVRKGGREVEGG